MKKNITRKKRISTQQIYQDLRQMIMDFDLFPGMRITETELADNFKVSRTPVREALQRLELEGFVSIRPKQGCFERISVSHKSSTTGSAMQEGEGKDVEVELAA